METMLDALLDWVYDFGIPEGLHPDQDSQFESRMFQAMCQSLSKLNTRITPFCSQSDGMVEKFNRTLKDMISKCFDKERLNWDLKVHGVQFVCTRHHELHILLYGAWV